MEKCGTWTTRSSCRHPAPYRTGERVLAAEESSVSSNTWVRCFTLKKAAAQAWTAATQAWTAAAKAWTAAAHQLAWLKYDIHFRMELAASADKRGSVAMCIVSASREGKRETPGRPAGKGNGKRPVDQQKMQPTKKAKKGVCRLHKRLPVWQRMHFRPSLFGLWGLWQASCPNSR